MNKKATDSDWLENRHEEFDKGVFSPPRSGTLYIKNPNNKVMQAKAKRFKRAVKKPKLTKKMIKHGFRAGTSVEPTAGCSSKIRELLRSDRNDDEDEGGGWGYSK